MHVVIKPFLGAGVNWERNQLVDGSAMFRNVDHLVNQRYLRAATPSEIASAYEADEPPAAPQPETKKKKIVIRRRKH